MSLKIYHVPNVAEIPIFNISFSMIFHIIYLTVNDKKRISNKKTDRKKNDKNIKLRERQKAICFLAIKEPSALLSISTKPHHNSNDCLDYVICIVEQYKTTCL